jgi:uridine kinase
MQSTRASPAAELETRPIMPCERSMDAVLEHYGRTVRPKQRELVESIKRYAHVIIPEGGHNTVALDSVVPRIDSMRREPP